MKVIIIVIVQIGIFLSLVYCQSCPSSSATNSSPSSSCGSCDRSSSTNDAESIETSVTQFSTAFYGVASQNASANMIISPISLQIALGLLYAGAKGTETIKTIQKSLKFPATQSQNAIEQQFHKLINNLTGEPSIQLADTIFLNQKFQIQPEFRNTIQTNFDATIQSINYENPSIAATTINEWITLKTNNTISNIISSADLSSVTELVLINTLYFHNEWTFPFSTSATIKQAFFPNGRCSDIAVEVDMMQNTKFFNYGNISSLNAQVIALPFRQSDINLYILLPNKECKGLEEVEMNLSTFDLKQLQEQLQATDVALSIPKFTINTNLNLQEPLVNLGLGSLFDGSANLNGILQSPVAISVSKALQASYINVNENGVTASAATAIISTRLAIFNPAQPLAFVVNRPFLFMLATDEIILFIGRVTNPNLIQ